MDRQKNLNVLSKKIRNSDHWDTVGSKKYGDGGKDGCNAMALTRRSFGYLGFLTAVVVTTAVVSWLGTNGAPPVFVSGRLRGGRGSFGLLRSWRASLAMVR